MRPRGASSTPAPTSATFAARSKMFVFCSDEPSSLTVWHPNRIGCIEEVLVCPRCHGSRWICEAHSQESWPHGSCPGPGMPCVLCNVGTCPEFPLPGQSWTPDFQCPIKPAWMRDDDILIERIDDARRASMREAADPLSPALTEWWRVLSDANDTSTYSSLGRAATYARWLLASGRGTAVYIRRRSIDEPEPFNPLSA